MRTTKFTILETTISYKDNVEVSERVKILTSQSSYSHLKPFYTEYIEQHEENYILFLNRANKV